MDARDVKTSKDFEVFLQERYNEFYPKGTHVGRTKCKINKLNIEASFSREEFFILEIRGSLLPLDEEIQPLLDHISEIMGDVRPMCGYRLISRNDGINYAYEWNVVDPDERIRELVNGRSHSDGSRVEKISLYNDKDIDNYVEKTKEKRIVGIDPGKYYRSSDDEITDEVSFWWRVHDTAVSYQETKNGINKSDPEELKFYLEYLANQSKRFGVDTSDVSETVLPTESKEFVTWYSFYRDHFFSRKPGCLTGEQLDNYYQVKERGLDTSVFMPSGNWRDSLDKPLTKEKVPQTDQN